MPPSSATQANRAKKLATVAITTPARALLTASLGMMPLGSAWADPPPPPNAQPLSSILAAAQTHSTPASSIVQADFDDGRWEITICQPDECHKHYIDPHSAAQLAQRRTDLKPMPHAEALPITQIAGQVEAARLGSITSVEWEHGHWQVELAIPTP
ncbi:MAG: hypothetical protein KIG95_13945 [Comamonas sp.]|nr:hypothetical protein [Comamonas sp.]